MLLLKTNLIVFICLSGVIIYAQSDKGWKLRKKQDGITVYTRASDSSDFRQLKMNVQLKTRLSALVALYKDVPGYMNWVYSCKVSEVLKGGAENEQYYYSESETPWPVSNRDATLYSVIEQDSNTLIVTSVSRSVIGLKPEVKGNVRVTKLYSVWTLVPMGDGMVDVTYFLSVDPAGWVPAWLMNMTIAIGPLKTLRNLREEIKKDKYTGAEFDFIKEP